MTQRMVKFKGVAFSITGSPVRVLLKYNNEIVFDNEVSTDQVDVYPPTSGIVSAESIILFEFTTTMDLTGNIPIEVVPTGGKLFFVHLEMNFGVTWTDIDTGTPIYKIETTSYVPPSVITVESDGLLNPTLNGVDYSYYRPIEAAQAWADTHNNTIGAWTIPIADSHLFKCDYIIDPNRTMFNRDTDEWGTWPPGVEL